MKMAVPTSATDNALRTIIAEPYQAEAWNGNGFAFVSITNADCSPSKFY
jgi:hypothetical protein